jgi:hypothetical protein
VGRLRKAEKPRDAGKVEARQEGRGSAGRPRLGRKAEGKVTPTTAERWQKAGQGEAEDQQRQEVREDGRVGRRESRQVRGLREGERSRRRSER